MLRGRSASALHLICRYNSRMISRMSTTAGSGAVEGVGVPTLIFPWLRQERPVLSSEETGAKLSFWRHSLLLLRSQISLEIIRHFLSHPGMETMSSTCGINYMDPRGGEFLTGARQAFTVCSNTIFRSITSAPIDEAMLDTAKLDISGYPPPRDLNADEVHEADMDQHEDINHTFDASATPVPRSHPASKTNFEKAIESLAETFHSVVFGSKKGEGHSSDVDEAIPIEYVNAWNIANQPPSARFASLSLDEVLDNRLASFFEEAWQVVSKKHSVHHVLHQVYMPSISHCEIIFNAQRGFNFDLIKRHYIFGVIGTAVLGDPPQKSAKNRGGFGRSATSTDIGGKRKRGEQLPYHMHAFTQEQKPEQMSPPTFTLNSRELSEWLELPHVQRAKAELKKMTHLATIRVHVNLPCKETFFVSESDSGLIVQGDCIPRDSTHQIVLEGSFSVREMKFPEFQVVDIDNWLEGNRFV